MIGQDVVVRPEPPQVLVYRGRAGGATGQFPRDAMRLPFLSSDLGLAAAVMERVARPLPAASGVLLDPEPDRRSGVVIRHHHLAVPVKLAQDWPSCKAAFKVPRTKVPVMDRTETVALRAGWERRGQALVEFALVLPALFLIILIALDFGRVYLAWVQLNNAARVGANYAAMTATAFTSGDAAYTSLIARELPGSSCEVPSSFPPDPTFTPNASLGSTATVSLTCNFRFITPVIGRVFGNSATLPVTATANFPIRVGTVYNVPNSAPVVPPP